MEQLCASVVTQVILDPKDLFQADRHAIERSHVELVQRQKLYAQRNKDLLARVQHLQNNIIEHNRVEIDLKRVERAHVAQKAFIQSLRANCAKHGRLKSKCKLQEKVIEELERLIKQNKTTGSNTSNSEFLSHAADLLARVADPDSVDPRYTQLGKEHAALLQQLERETAEFHEHEKKSDRANKALKDMQKRVAQVEAGELEAKVT